MRLSNLFVLALIVQSSAISEKCTESPMGGSWNPDFDESSFLQHHLKQANIQNISQPAAQVQNISAPDELENALNMMGAQGNSVNTELGAINTLAAALTPEEAVHNGVLVTLHDIAQITGENAMDHGCGGNLCYQGDMQATSPQEQALFQRMSATVGHRGNQSLKTNWVAAGAPWTNGRVKYCFASDIDADIRQLFELAISQISKAVPCISFENVGNSAGRTSNAHDTSKVCDANPAIFVQSKTDSGCWSYVGMQNTPFYAQIADGSVQLLQAQMLNLRPSGCAVLGIAIHEIGHALGMAHEQSRPDRDEYVVVHWNNIAENARHNFDIDNNGYVAQPYDFLSVMHYGNDDFSVNGQATLTTADGVHDNQIGQLIGLSQHDADQLADMYREVVSACTANMINHNEGCDDKDPTYCSALTVCSTENDMDKCCGCGGGLTYQCYSGTECNHPATLPIANHAACVADRTALFGGAYSCVTEHVCDYAVRIQCASAPGYYWDYAPGACCQLPPFGTAICERSGCTFQQV